MAITLDGTTGITTPGLTNTGTETIVSLTTTGNTTLGDATSDTLTVGVTGIVKDASGNVGIGTATPSYKLDVRSSLAVLDGSANIGFYANGTSYTQVWQTFQSPNDLLIKTTAAKYIAFLPNSAEAMRIDSSGNLLVAQSATSQTTIGASMQSSGQVYSCLAASTNASTSYLIYSTGAGAYRFYVQMDGKINATSTTIAAISDIRLKENVRDLDFGLSEIMSLKPRRFDWKENKGMNIKNAVGFIAQEFEIVFPASVSTSLAGEDGIEYKNICHEELIPTFVKAIQEQQALITALTARITALETP